MRCGSSTGNSIWASCKRSARRLWRSDRAMAWLGTAVVLVLWASLILWMFHVTAQRFG